MKPRNFVTNILLTLLFIAQIFISAFTPHWQLLFFGVIGVILMIPEWILTPKHRAAYISVKAVFQVLIIVLGVLMALYGFVIFVTYDLAESLAQGCGGGEANISHSPFDKFSAQFTMFMILPVLFKVIMNIVDFALYRKERRKYIK